MSTRKSSTDRTKLEKSTSFFTRPSVYHALVIIFLEFFAFGLLTAPMITVLDETFPRQTFLMNGLIHGIKGLLSFLSAPLIGGLSDVFGRKSFLLLTVTCTCAPIPLLNVSHWWYFTIFSLSGIFSVTFSVVFAYVADITTEEDRSWTYGLVSATFAASLVTSPSIGAYLGRSYGYNFVIALATAVALLDIFFILAFVPESLPAKSRPTIWGSRISCEKADPFRSLKRIGSDPLILMLCIVTFLSFLPEAGEYSCFFVYLRLVMGFSEEGVALFIAVVGITSCLAQTVGLSMLISRVGPKHAIIVGLVFEMVQLACYGFATEKWLLWVAGIIAGTGSITYPAISAFLSTHADKDQQGVTQGVLTGIRGLCNGLGPALFGFVFYIFQVDLSDKPKSDLLPTKLSPSLQGNMTMDIIAQLHHFHEKIMPGPPFAFGSVLVFMAILVSVLIPKSPHGTLSLLTRIPHPLPHRQHSSDDGRASPNSDSQTLFHHHNSGTDFDYINDLVEDSLRSTSTAGVASSSDSHKETLRRSKSITSTNETCYPRTTGNAAGNRFLHFWMRWRREHKRPAPKEVTVEEDEVDIGSSRSVLAKIFSTSGSSPHKQHEGKNITASVEAASVRRPLLSFDSDGIALSSSSEEERMRHRDQYVASNMESVKSSLLIKKTDDIHSRKTSRSLLPSSITSHKAFRPGASNSIGSGKIASQ